VSRDRIFVLKPGFEDPAQPGPLFFCPYSNQIEGLLATYPEVAAKVELIRLSFPKPRHPVVDLLGEENQSLPVLILGDDAGPAPEDAAVTPEGLRYISNTRRILETLSERYGIPRPH